MFRPIANIVALIVGGIEALNILATELNLSGPVWDQIGNLNENFGSLGIIVLLFIASWVVSTLVYKVKGYDELEIRMVSQPNQKM
jgi:high-affinity nickel-transport protein